MKRIYLNLKRFDVAKSIGGVNDIAQPSKWSGKIVEGIEKGISDVQGVDFAAFFPEGHLLNASETAKKLKIGCQGVFRKDVEAGKNFGAFTTLLTAKSAVGLGAKMAIIGHCEERNNLRDIITEGGGSDFNAINRILHEEVLRAREAGLTVLYCVGERSDETDNRDSVLLDQINVGLKGVYDGVVVAYEPVWSIGPGRPVPTAEYIDQVARLIKSAKNVDVIYGGGLKLDNAQMIADIDSVDGGLIALTTFGADFGFSVDNYLKIVKKYLGKGE